MSSPSAFPDLSPAARNLAAALLLRAADEFSNHGCDDLRLPATPANADFVRGLNLWAGDLSAVVTPWMSADGTAFVLHDAVVMRYCAELLSPMLNGG